MNEKNKIDLFENENDYILYEIQNIDQREADINDQEIKNETIDILVQKSKFDYNQQLLERIKIIKNLIEVSFQLGKTLSKR